MPTDQEHLAKAGIDAETGGSVSNTPDTASTADASAPQTEAPKQTEFFEIGENKFPTNTEFKLAHDGKVLKVPYSTLANTYRQFSHLQDKHKTFNEDRQKWEAQKSEYDQAMAFKQKYGALQDWSEKNPKDFETIWNLYQNKDKHLLEAQVQSNPAQVGGMNQSNQFKPFIDEISNLKQQLQGLNDFKGTFENKQKEEREAKDTEMILGEKNQFQKDYPEINLEERDPDGVTLWAKVMQYGIQSRLPDFESAALKYLKPRLQDTWASRARNEVVKGFKTDRQQGIVQRSAQPITGQGQSKTTDPRKMSYAELADMAKSGHFAGV